jgi:hypothetical protein
VQRAKGSRRDRKYLDDIRLLGYCPRGDVIADTSVFLLSDKARFITGCILSINTHKTVEVAVWLNEKGIVLMGVGVLYLVFGFILTRVHH